MKVQMFFVSRFRVKRKFLLEEKMFQFVFESVHDMVKVVVGFQDRKLPH